MGLFGNSLVQHPCSHLNFDYFQHHCFKSRKPRKDTKRPLKCEDTQTSRADRCMPEYTCDCDLQFTQTGENATCTDADCTAEVHQLSNCPRLAAQNQKPTALLPLIVAMQSSNRFGAVIAVIEVFQFGWFQFQRCKFNRIILYTTLNTLYEHPFTLSELTFELCRRPRRDHNKPD